MVLIQTPSVRILIKAVFSSVTTYVWKFMSSYVLGTDVAILMTVRFFYIDTFL